ncbi:MAG: hypothetical protein R3F11_22410 [Verrucomicrobiales bacterium]
MLRAEERRQLDAARLAQQVDGRPPFPVDPAVVGDQADALAPERSEFLGSKDIDARSGARRRGGGGQKNRGGGGR